MEKSLLKNTLRELYSDFYEDRLPEMTRRLTTIPEVPRSATVVLGMRRTGKTFLLYQRMNDLLASGVSKDRMLHVNFEDDRLMGMTVEDLRFVPDVYYQMFPENRNKLCYFFFDEIQNILHWESFVRRMSKFTFPDLPPNFFPGRLPRPCADVRSRLKICRFRSRNSCVIINISRRFRGTSAAHPGANSKMPWINISP